MHNNASKRTLVAAFAIGAAVALSPVASAEPPPPCDNTGEATVCDSPGESSITTGPSDRVDDGTMGRGPGGANNQNGAYGPSGDTPPVGRN